MKIKTISTSRNGKLIPKNNYLFVGYISSEVENTLQQKLLFTDYNLIKRKFKDLYFNDMELYAMFHLPCYVSQASETWHHLSAFINKLLVLERNARSWV